MSWLDAISDRARSEERRDLERARTALAERYRLRVDHMGHLDAVLASRFGVPPGTVAWSVAVEEAAILGVFPPLGGTRRLPIAMSWAEWFRSRKDATFRAGWVDPRSEILVAKPMDTAAQLERFLDAWPYWVDQDTAALVVARQAVGRSAPVILPRPPVMKAEQTRPVDS